jgi:chemotaxis regulatin CheY-phosphate phosphatase CheZ
MAFWDRFLIQAPKQTSEVKAQYAPLVMGDDFGYFNTQLITKVSRDVAMSLPAIVANQPTRNWHHPSGLSNLLFTSHDR